VAFLARYRGRTLEAYRHDLCDLFQCAADHHLAVLEATRTRSSWRPRATRRRLLQRFSDASTYDDRP
jgi:hypothetical protein